LITLDYSFFVTVLVFRRFSVKICDSFCTEAQVAEVLGVTNAKIWNWIKNGRFDIQRVGSEVLIPKREIELIKTKERKQNAQTRKRPYDGHTCGTEQRIWFY